MPWGWFSLLVAGEGFVNAQVSTLTLWTAPTFSLRMTQCNSDKTKADTDAEREGGKKQPVSFCNVILAHQGSRASVLSSDLLNQHGSLDRMEADRAWRWSDEDHLEGCDGGSFTWRIMGYTWSHIIRITSPHRLTCGDTDFIFVFVMDWMQWSLLPPPTGSAWPSVPEEFNETLALTTALSYSLLACEKCMLHYCFEPVSTSSCPAWTGSHLPPECSVLCSVLGCWRSRCTMLLCHFMVTWCHCLATWLTCWNPSHNESFFIVLIMMVRDVEVNIKLNWDPLKFAYENYTVKWLKVSIHLCVNI